MVRSGDGDRPLELHLQRIDPQDSSGLEKIFGERKAFLDRVWLARGLEVSACVCVVRFGKAPQGTGFLIGPDLVITCRHVVAAVLDGKRPLTELRFVFDHANRIDGTTLPAIDIGTFVCHAQSPTTVFDFALFQLERSPDRGSIAVEEGPWDPTKNSGLAILQHPKGEPQKLAVDPDAHGTLSDDTQRLLHTIPTSDGSSGSPVFGGEKWTLVALHQGWEGDWNKSIPLWLIASNPVVVEQIAAATKRAPTQLKSAPFDEGVRLLCDGQYAQRAKGRRLLLAVRVQTPDLEIPADLVALLIAQCEKGTAEEQKSAYELVRKLGIGERARERAAARWFEDETPGEVVQAIAELFGEDDAGFHLVCEALRRVEVPLANSLEQRAQVAIECIRAHIHRGVTDDQSRQAITVVARFRESAVLHETITSLYVEITGRPPNPSHDKPPRKVTGFDASPPPKRDRIRLALRIGVFSLTIVAGTVLVVPQIWSTLAPAAIPDAGSLALNWDAGVPGDALSDASVTAVQWPRSQIPLIVKAKDTVRLKAGAQLTYSSCHIEKGGTLVIEGDEWTMLGCALDLQLDGTIRVIGGRSAEAGRRADTAPDGTPLVCQLEQSAGGAGGRHTECASKAAATLAGASRYGNGGGGAGGRMHQFVQRDPQSNNCSLGPAGGDGGGDATQSRGGTGGMVGYATGLAVGGKGGSVPSGSGSAGGQDRHNGLSPETTYGGAGGGGGARGRHGGCLYLRVQGTVSGTGEIDISGESGGAGGDGGAQGSMCCSSSPFYRGGSGGGGGGGAGGSGGMLEVRTVGPLPATIAIKQAGGNGGAGGRSGGSDSEPGMSAAKGADRVRDDGARTTGTEHTGGAASGIPDAGCDVKRLKGALEKLNTFKPVGTIEMQSHPVTHEEYEVYTSCFSIGLSTSGVSALNARKFCSDIDARLAHEAEWKELATTLQKQGVSAPLNEWTADDRKGRPVAFDSASGEFPALNDKNASYPFIGFRCVRPK